MSFTTELRVPPDTVFASLIETFTDDAAQRSEFDAEHRRGLVTAAREGFTAIVQDALAESREPIHAVASLTPADLRLSLFERGLPIDDAFARRDPRWDALCARVDAAHWRSHGTTGSELRLVVNRPHGLLHAATTPRAGEEDVVPAPLQEYAVRRFQPADAGASAVHFT